MTAQSSRKPVLWQIEISHYSEKVRWALEHKGIDHVRRTPLPGTHIPIFPPEKIRETRPRYVFILPWNLKDEIMEQLAYIRGWGGQFVVPIPDVKIFS